MDNTGVRKVVHGAVVEAITWDSLTAVEILTTSDGPISEDVFWGLHGTGVNGVVVPAGLAPDGFVERLQALPGFDNTALIAAMGSTTDASFPCWSRST